LKESDCCLKREHFLPYVNERDGVGKLVECDPPYTLKDQKSFSIHKSLRAMKTNPNWTKLSINVNDKVLVQDSDRSI